MTNDEERLWAFGLFVVSKSRGEERERKREQKVSCAAKMMVRDFAASLLLLLVAAVAFEIGARSLRRDFFHAVTGSATAFSGISLPVNAAAMGSSIKLPPMGLGAWAWGDSIFWGYDKNNDDELKKVFDYAFQNSKSPTALLDTAKIYGFDRSEKLIREFSKDYDQSKIQVATKFAALPFRTKPDDVIKAREASLKRLNHPIDLYQ